MARLHRKCSVLAPAHVNGGNQVVNRKNGSVVQRARVVSAALRARKARTVIGSSSTAWARSVRHGERPHPPLGKVEGPSEPSSPTIPPLNAIRESSDGTLIARVSVVRVVLNTGIFRKRRLHRGYQLPKMESPNVARARRSLSNRQREPLLAGSGFILRNKKKV